jgi:DNA-binding NarL/FixJ family response regulator
MEALSAEQIARKCHCSKATIINRLRTIRRRTGASPDKLRTYSAQFERIENSLADPRARRISRRELVDEEVGEEDGEYR